MRPPAVGAQHEREWEARFAAIPSPDSIRSHMQRLSARPHHVGSPYDVDNARRILARFTAWGLDARIERFDVLFPTPRDRLVELAAPTRFVARLAEPTVPGDPTKSQHAEQLPTYTAYLAGGEDGGGVYHSIYDDVSWYTHFSDTAEWRTAADSAPGGAALPAVNALLLRSERRLTDARGLPRRPWYVHELYAPGFYTGYGVKTLPAVREPIEQRDFDEAAEGIRRAGAALDAEAALVDSAAAALRGAMR